MESFELLLELFPDYVVKLLVALLCGAILGYERERRDKPAGLRTIVLITIGSTLYMIVSELIPQVSAGPVSITQADPARVAAQVVSGIGFLGAGTIIQSRGSVHGLTTAAVIWVAAAIGLCIGLGFPILAIGFTLVVLAAIKVMSLTRAQISRSGSEVELDIVVPNDSLRLQQIRSLLFEMGAHVLTFDVTSRGGSEVEVRLSYLVSPNAAAGILAAIGEIEGVRGKPV
jgi:putative Mg2+ transporter-C (MgtC) family protein